MDKSAKTLQKIRNGQANIPYEDLKKLCGHYFGAPRQSNGSHAVFKTPWQGDPRINIQRGKDGKAKKYQMAQVLKAINYLEEEKERSSCQ